MSINSKGGGIFIGYVYSVLSSIPTVPNSTAAKNGMAYTKTFTTPAGATFKINEGKNYTLTTTLDGKTPMTTTYTNVTTLSFTNGGFLGIKDFISECIVASLSDTKMIANIFISTVAPPGGTLIGTPNMALTLTFEVAP